MEQSVGQGSSSGPPSPTGKKKIPPPGLPVDDWVMVLLLAAVVYGGYVIYKHSRKVEGIIKK